MTFRELVTDTNPAFIAAFGEPVTFAYDTEAIPCNAIVNIADRPVWLTDDQDQTLILSLDCDPVDVSWLTDELATHWRVSARGRLYNIAGIARNEMTTVYLRVILPEDIDADQGY